MWGCFFCVCVCVFWGGVGWGGLLKPDLHQFHLCGTNLFLFVTFCCCVFMEADGGRLWMHVGMSEGGNLMNSVGLFNVYIGNFNLDSRDQWNFLSLQKNIFSIFSVVSIWSLKLYSGILLTLHDHAGSSDVNPFCKIKNAFKKQAFSFSFLNASWLSSCALGFWFWFCFSLVLFYVSFYFHKMPYWITVSDTASDESV